MSEPWPTELRLADHGRVLHVTFDDGQNFALRAELLRVESPSAEVQGHGPGQEQLVWGKKYVSIKAVEPVGTYAVRLTFSDGHASGIYTWNYLGRLGQEESVIWQAYLHKLESAGLNREA